MGYNLGQDRLGKRFDVRRSSLNEADRVKTLYQHAQRPQKRSSSEVGFQGDSHSQRMVCIRSKTAPDVESSASPTMAAIQPRSHSSRSTDLRRVFRRREASRGVARSILLVLLLVLLPLPGRRECLGQQLLHHRPDVLLHLVDTPRRWSVSRARADSPRRA